MLNRSIEQAQKRVEQQNYQIRKRVLEYDDVMNKQREVIYGFRNEIINAADVRDRLMDIMEEVVIQKVEQLTSGTSAPHEWNLRPLSDWVNLNFPIGISEKQLQSIGESGTDAPVPGSAFDSLTAAQFAVCLHVAKSVRDAYELKIQFETDAEALVTVERYTVLGAIDKLWQEHLYNMDSLRNSIGLRAIGQRDPLIEYKAEAYKVFEDLMMSVKTEICHNIFRSASSMLAFENFLRNLPQQQTHSDTSAYGATGGGSTTSSTASASTSSAGGDMVAEANEAVAKARPVRLAAKVGRNDPCPCGSGKKFKQCCGR
jgi:preprotein translocase subunit SecA